MKITLGILVTSFLWAMIWGTMAYVAVLATAFFNPDFGHVGPGLTAMIMAGVGAISGTIAGLVFAVLSWLSSPLSQRGRLLFGVMVGGTAGFVPAILIHPPYFRIAPITAALGAFSGLCSAPPQRSRKFDAG